MHIINNAWALISSLYLGLVLGQSDFQFVTGDPETEICMKHGNDVSCENITECPHFKGTINTSNKDNSIIMKVLKSLTCGFHGNSPKICCIPAADFIKHYNSLSDIDTSSRPLNIGRGPTRTGDGLASDKYSCDSGVRLDYRISGGVNTKYFEFPWLARIATRDLYVQKNRFTCMGALLSDRYVVTAAHCASQRNKPLKGVRLGEYDAETETDCYNDVCTRPLDIAVTNIIIHEDFTGDPEHGNDIALLQLSRPVNFTATVRPICLPKSPEIYKNDYDPSNQIKMNYIAAGWGKTELGTFPIARKVTLPSVEVSTCIDKFGLSEALRDSIICAGGERGKDVCTGDSGTPLVFQNGSLWHIYGIASTGHLRCGTKGVPGIYTRVTKYIDWIMKNMT